MTRHAYLLPVLAALCLAGLSACGDDGGDSADAGTCTVKCGSACCSADQTCNAATNTCEKPSSCTPSCSGKSCGDDGCGGSCGTCAPGVACNAGQCAGGGSDAGEPPDASEPPDAANVPPDAGTNDAGFTIPPNDTCAGAEPLTFTADKATVTGDTRGATDNGIGSCTFTQNVPDVVYSFTLSATKTVVAKLTRDASTASYNPVVYIRAVCASSTSTDQKACATNSSGVATATASSLGAGTYYVWVDGGSGSTAGGKFTLEVSLVTPVAGDTCDSATALTFTNNVATATGSTAATGVTNDTTSGCGGSGPDVVYSFTTTAAQKVTATLTPTSGSTSYQAVVSLRKTCSDSATEVDSACADLSSAAGTAQSVSAFNLAAGTYFVWVDGYSSTKGDFTLEVKLEPPVVPPANDSCTAPATLTFTNNVATATGTTTIPGTASDTSASCGGSGPDVVYQFTTTAAQKVTATLTPTSSSTSWEAVVSIRKTCTDSTSEVDATCGDTVAGQPVSATASNLPAGTYFVWVDGYASTKGDYSLEVKLDPPVPAPANDTCTGAEALTFTSGVATATGTTSSAAADTGGTCSSSSAGANDVVYTFTTTAAQKFSATVTPSSASPSFEPVVYLKKVCMSSTATDEVACSSGGAGQATGVLEYNLPAGTYFLWVDGASKTKGDFTLTAALDAPVTAAPTNDQCTGEVLTFTNDVASFSGQTITATEDGHGTCASWSTAPDVVYQFTTTAAKAVKAEVTAKPSTPTFTPTLFIRKASCASTTSADEVACESAGASTTNSATIDNLPAGTYWLWVEGGSSTDSGEFNGSVTLSAPIPPPANDSCTAPAALTAGTLTNGTLVASTNDYGNGTESAACSADLYSPYDSDVVYQFAETTTGTRTITVVPQTSPVAMDVAVWVTSGATCDGALSSCLYGTDVGYDGDTETLTFNTTAGTTYYIVVAEYGTKGTFTIKIQ